MIFFGLEIIGFFFILSYGLKETLEKSNPRVIINDYKQSPPKYEDNDLSNDNINFHNPPLYVE